MNRSPSITVAIPTYRGVSHVGAALQSILAQDGLEFDVLVVDDRSDDETVEVVRRLAGDRARVEVNSERLGLARNWNRCVALARTPLVAVFHQDDVMRPGHLARHVAAFTPETGLVASAVRMIDGDGLPISPKVVDPGGCGPIDRRFHAGAFIDRLAERNPLRCSAVTIRASAHAAVGGFNPALRYVVDWEMWLRVARSSEVAWIAEPTVDVRWHLESETHRFASGVADLVETRRLLDEIASSHPAAAAHRTPALRRLGRAYLNRAYQAARSDRRSLARSCLIEALELSPPLATRILVDPRLAFRLIQGGLTPPTS